MASLLSRCQSYCPVGTLSGAEAADRGQAVGIVRCKLDAGVVAAARSRVMGFGIMISLVFFVGGLVFAFGLIGDQKMLIGAGLLVLALSAIFGLQPDWPVKRSE
jgi:hypothetical protein